MLSQQFFLLTVSLGTIVTLISSNVYAQTVSNDCILKTIKTEKGSMTISEVRALCEKGSLTTDKTTVYESNALEE
jgi:hypothetical protein